MNFLGLPLLLVFVLPNYHFHLNTIYAILSHMGVDVVCRQILDVDGQFSAKVAIIYELINLQAQHKDDLIMAIEKASCYTGFVYNVS